MAKYNRSPGARKKRKWNKNVGDPNLKTYSAPKEK